MKKLTLAIVINSLFVIMGLSSIIALGGRQSTPLDADTGPSTAPDSFSDERSFMHRPHAAKEARSLALDSAAQRSGGLTVDPQNREASRRFFYNYYVVDNPVIDWTGNFDECEPGTTSRNFSDATLQQINYFRAMAGVPADIAFKAEFNRKAQAAALMMGVNDQLNHSPPTNWKCYSADGHDGAGNSNLSLGANGASGIANGYMRDDGDYNWAVGHRRWILYPQTLFMGTGDVAVENGHKSANALWVIDSDHMYQLRPITRETFVAWPPPGYVPYGVVFARWSFSYPEADFSSSSVHMWQAGSVVPVKVEPIKIGYGENSLAWIPQKTNQWDPWPRPDEDTTYHIKIGNVIIGEKVQDFSYDVIVFDPFETMYIPIVSNGGT